MQNKKEFPLFYDARGFGLIEATISIGITTVFLVAFVSLILQAEKTSQINNKELRAEMYLQELIEISKDLEQSDWDALTCTSATCYPGIQHTPDRWVLSSGSESLESGFYTRSISIADVTDSGIPDVTAKKVTANIEWHDGSQLRTMKMESYLYHHNVP